MNEVAYSLWPVILWTAAVFLFIIGLGLGVARKTGLMGLLIFWIAAALLFWLGFNIQDHNQIPFPGEVPMNQQAPSVPVNGETLPNDHSPEKTTKPVAPPNPAITPKVKQEALEDVEGLQ